VPRSNIGEPSLYGVYYDDTEYDYMQHLRPVGRREEGFESILAEAPKKRITSTKTSDPPFSLYDLPPEVLPSASELPRDFESQAAVQSLISGLQPNMDRHLRQTLEALEDDAYVDDDLDDDFFGELTKDGERDAGEPFEYEFKEDNLPTGGTDAAERDDEGEPEWLAKFAAFQKEQQSRKRRGTSPSDNESEEADTIGQMPEFPATGTRRGRRGTSDASGLSMSSSSIFRSEGLTDLDERFDQVSVLESVAYLFTAKEAFRLRRSTWMMKGVKMGPRTQMILTRHRSSSRREKILTLSWTISYITMTCQGAR